ncbi:MAG: cyclic nucleotide-binding domain-containing protein [Lentisphaerae bacterium]|jgi:hemerythrin|nr:cyclic nucleotide-binding domain-containing protein [Lentisphaerota bacterium]MBT4821890.1 cyclic nucleotide-binding domain-containing protein [Lentisphaerota bacterium]MBT5606782.1 cyclic nucleotide-binding domain-containing protein [Lentisphaerota bacterium]MBT7061578.1 cyclic nucleotide-binding domain-containing protein [Lentisphaerota bacterium]MBT7843871.1 cyclic nucleotide-binding domain-containing protein [Lentisphaerota bacterium]
MSGIHKTQVSEGIYWIAIPEADLRVLCACPSDSIKHLRKQGLIQTKEESGVTFETWANAILLSDVLLQNGGFANLAEFPVLQMLYFQGMLLPNHPNNTGRRPLLVGSEEQVRAQLEYIYRGNYGLACEEELMAAGATQAEAAEQMRLKLRFAFGTIRPTGELLDSVVVRGEPIEIRSGVMIRRLAVNVFEFSHDGESVTVDLNLSANERYRSPYPLGNCRVGREYFAVVHSGNGDGWDVSRPAMSSILMFQGKVYLIDAEPNIINTLGALGIGVNEIEGIFHTHAHDDHFSGLTALMRSDHRIKYFATPLVCSSVMKKLAALLSMEEDEIADFMDIHLLGAGSWNDIETLQVKPVFSPHPVETTIMVFRAAGESGYRTYAHFADIIDLGVLAKMVEPDPTRPGVSAATFDCVKRDYLLKADLKKIDVGGGMIHGNAEDFRADSSQKIVLSHTHAPLTAAQKEIGSGVPFGAVDVLIPSHRDYVWEYAFSYLESYFPGAPAHQLQTLLNNPLVTFKPEETLLRAREKHRDMYLVLTGDVEAVHRGSDRRRVISAGGFVGESSTFGGVAASRTYRAVGFVQALRLPRPSYIRFIRRNGLYPTTKRLKQKRDFLQQTWLFGEAISYPVQNRLAQTMQLEELAPESQVVVGRDAGISIVVSGTLELIADGVLEILGPGEFYGEGSVLHDSAALYRVRAGEGGGEVYKVPREALLGIPVVRWKLYEVHERRTRTLVDQQLVAGAMFRWRDEYGTNVRAMDAQHREIFGLAERLRDAILLGSGSAGKVRRVAAALITHTQKHFAEETALMLEHDFAGVEKHGRKHAKLLQTLTELCSQSEPGGVDASFTEFLHEWVTHLLTEDRQYGGHLNDLGIF